MTASQKINTVGIIGLILGLIALIVSFIECVGMLAFIPGIIGLVLGIISLLENRDEGQPMGMSIAVVVISLVACVISAFHFYNWGKALSETKNNLKEFETCEEVKEDFDRVEREMAELTRDIENENSPLNSIVGMSKLGIQLDHIEKYSEKIRM